MGMGKVAGRMAIDEAVQGVEMVAEAVGSAKEREELKIREFQLLAENVGKEEAKGRASIFNQRSPVRPKPPVAPPPPALLLSTDNALGALGLGAGPRPGCRHTAVAPVVPWGRRSLRAWPSGWPRRPP